MSIIDEQSRITAEVSSAAANVADQILDSVVLVHSRGGSGSGVIWDADGLIVTNSHVVHGERAQVVLRDGEKLEATLEARDARRDLAALRVPARGLRAARLGDSTRIHVGQVVLAAGNPLGLRGVVTAGIVTGAGQVIADGQTRLGDLIQADVALAPGNSGGPLADAEGRVLGINAMIGAAGIALAIPTEVVQSFLAPQRAGSIYVGIAGLPVRPRMEGKERGGVLLTSVEEGSPADRAGLLQGDLLLAFDGHDVETAEAYFERLAAWTSGEPVRLSVQRGGEPREFTVVPVIRASV